MSMPAVPNRPASGNSAQQQLAELDALLERMLALPVNQVPDPPARHPEPRKEQEENAILQLADAPVPAPALSTDPVQDQEEVEDNDRPLPGPSILAPILNILPRSEEKEVEPEEADLTPGQQEKVEVHASQTALLNDPPVLPPGPADPGEELLTAPEIKEQPKPESAPAAAARVPGEKPRALPPVLPWQPPPMARKPTPRQRSSGVGLRLEPLLWINRTFDACVSRLGRPGSWLREPAGRAVLGWSGVGLLVGALAWGFLDWIGWTW